MYSSRYSTNISAVFKVGLVVGVLVLITRMLDLEIVKGDIIDHFGGDRLRSVVIQAPRGKIYARGGEVLADNIESKKNVVFDPKNGYVKRKSFTNCTS